MASRQELDTIAQKAMEDDKFRVALETDPGKAAASLGIKLTADQVSKLKKAAAEKVGDRKSKLIVYG